MMEYYLWGEESRLQKLTELGDPLEWMSKDVPWEIFREDLEAAMKKEPKGEGGRPPYDYVFLFRCVILQITLNISYDKLEFLLNDSLSAQRAVGACVSTKIPDAKTIWHFKEILSQKHEGKALFEIFNGHISEEGYLKKKIVGVDATIINTPIQRNTREENAMLKKGIIPEDWLADTPKAKHKLAQKNTGSAWGSKHGDYVHGNKDNVCADLEDKLIVDYSVTSARPHDSNMFLDLLPEEAEEVYADSAYYGHRDSLPEGVKACICVPASRNHKLTPEEEARNHEYSKTRCRAEHLFAAMKWNWPGGLMRCIGAARQEFHIGMMNLSYNMRRFSFLKKQASVMG